jgi:hypothetical protein
VDRAEAFADAGIGEEMRVCIESPGDSGTLMPLSLPAFRVFEDAEKCPRVPVSAKTFCASGTGSSGLFPENVKAVGRGLGP